MTAKVLVVDDVHVIRKVLEAKLVAEFFEVALAGSGQEALEKARTENPDIILLDVMMPDIDGFEVCRRLKADPLTSHIPVVMITGLDHPSDRIAGLKAGADDFLTKPTNDVALFARVRNLVRLKTMFDELRLREVTGLSLGLVSLSDQARDAAAIAGAPILVVEDDPASVDALKPILSNHSGLRVVGDEAAARQAVTEADWDLVVVSLALPGQQGLRLCAFLRASERLRQVPVLVLSKGGDDRSLLRALDLGVNDYVTKPIDKAELQARVNSQLRRKIYQDRLRATMQKTAEMALIDPLTGLYNRRYLENHLSARMDQDRGGERRSTVLMLLDLDHFKSINDTYGHAAGDAVLKQFAHRIRMNVRGVDLAARYGGEEFIVVMPETMADEARMIADRLVRVTAQEPFHIGDGREISVTVSAGVAQIAEGERPGEVIRRADEALYRSKAEGRNRVTMT
ncbi:PleD family two-component system response regulator [Zavarzinia compransoris]|uniref:PleD family two-component system response regulator n=1 Tax=Zavarzinia marina TaxID=2911065 RepID=UPI001F1E089B|nr:PleD family two-component system response regulator [Zavarzinia marina]MCF4166629.1 PleD family two-component system response regulator [Zavarzinia marina]